MEIRKIRIEKLNPAPYNPRRDLKPGDKIYEALKKSLDEFELVDPLNMNSVDLWTRNGKFMVIDGYQRLKIIERKGEKPANLSLFRSRFHSLRGTLLVFMVAEGWRESAGNTG